eukprot:gene1095-15430_t
MKDLRRHPYIVSLCDVIREQESTTLMLEYVSNTCYLNGIAKWANFTETDAQVSMKQLLQAINYCHRHKVIHRDLSPLNILWVQRPTFMKPDVSPWLKLIDFNLARRVSDGKSIIECDPLGTDLFMSPESLKDKCQIGLSNDVWSLGVLLFFTLVGYPPFWCDNYSHLLKNIEEGSYCMPKRYWSSVSSEAQDLVKEMLIVKPSRRITAADALKHQWFRKNLSDDSKMKTELSIVQSRITVHLNRTAPSNRQINNTSRVFPRLSTRKAHVPDKELDMLALQIKENNNI